MRLGRWLAQDRTRRWARVLSGLLLAPVVALAVAAGIEPMPPALSAVAGGEETSVRILDGAGRTLREVRSSDGMLSERVSLAALPHDVPQAVLAAEDARFYWHPGVDPLANLRAAAQALWHLRIVSGASTVTQQLARNVVARPPTLRGKLREMAIALRIEASLGKRRILEEYLNRVEFGPNVRGIEAASRLYFDKPASKLSLGEAATLASIPRGPTLYDPRRGTERVERRRNRVLDRMQEQGFASAEAVAAAKATPVVLQRRTAEGGARHFTRAILSGALAPELTGQPMSEIQTTLDSDLQREVETLVRDTAERIAPFDASAAAVIVIDNRTGDVLAHVGSPDFFDARAQGQNDGVLALRQPGSTLKPFVYATAMKQGGVTPATLLPDVELHIATPEGDYSPKNYDGRFHGPVRLREALASSLNVPAVFVAQETGPHHVLATLRAIGFTSLSQPAEHYGAAIALGDGEVTLKELAEAYSTLARGGLHRPLRAVRRARLAPGDRPASELALPPAAETRVMDAELAALLTDVLSDPHARTGAFGRGNVLELDFPVAAKTGTSKGFRDNWTVGFTHEVTVAVWVGNFDGHPMSGSSGVTGAAPLFADVMRAAMRGEEPAPLFDQRGLVEVEVCALSGKRPGPSCNHRVHERFRAGQEPHEGCDLHVEVAIDRRNGLRAGPGCTFAQQKAFESYPERFASWATRAGRPVVPAAWSPLCPGQDPGSPRGRVALAYPFDGARFAFDDGLAQGQQSIVLSARAPSGTPSVRFIVDGRVVASVGAPFSAPYRLAKGEHRVVVETAEGQRSDAVRFAVE